MFLTYAYIWVLRTSLPVHTLGYSVHTQQPSRCQRRTQNTEHMLNSSEIQNPYELRVIWGKVQQLKISTILKLHILPVTWAHLQVYFQLHPIRAGPGDYLYISRVHTHVEVVGLQIPQVPQLHTQVPKYQFRGPYIYMSTSCILAYLVGSHLHLSIELDQSEAGSDSHLQRYFTLSM